MRGWSIFVRVFGPGQADNTGRDDRSRPRRLEASVEGLEGRQLLSGGSVVQNGALAIITPASTGPNVAIVSYQSHNGVKMLDVNLNGADKYFSLPQVAFVYYEGSGISGAQTFMDSTSLHTVAWGGTGANHFQGGSGQDEFFGGSGSNTFDAGSGFDVLVGGAGANVFNENASGSGEILEAGSQNTIIVPQGATGHYTII
jgi:Ca2+-binding RTX toxin-like protein